MADNSAGFHEDVSALQPATVERHRAIASLMEELEAVDWYDQRIDATADASLASVLRHNRDEEKEHAAMNLEWLRRHDPELDRFLRVYLFTDGSITALEDALEGDDEDAAPAAAAGVGRTGTGLGIGSLRDRKETL